MMTYAFERRAIEPGDLAYRITDAGIGAGYLPCRVVRVGPGSF